MLGALEDETLHSEKKVAEADTLLGNRRGPRLGRLMGNERTNVTRVGEVGAEEEEEEGEVKENSKEWQASQTEK